MERKRRQQRERCSFVMMICSYLPSLNRVASGDSLEHSKTFLGKMIFWGNNLYTLQSLPWLLCFSWSTNSVWNHLSPHCCNIKIVSDNLCKTFSNQQFNNHSQFTLTGQLCKDESTIYRIFNLSPKLFLFFTQHL